MNRPRRRLLRTTDRRPYRLGPVGLLCLLSWAVALPVAADNAVGSWPWSEQVEAGLAVGHMVEVDGTPFLEIDEQSSGRMPLLVVNEPRIETTAFALRLDVASEDLAGLVFLEMWTIFPDGSRYFSRTLGPKAMAPLRGTTPRRSAVLPFQLRPEAPKPVVLELYLVFAGPEALTPEGRPDVTLEPSTPSSTPQSTSAGQGIVRLGTPELLVFDAEEALPVEVPSGGWWGAQGAAILGTAAGLFYGLLGTLIGLLGGRRDARRTVLRLVGAMVIGGLVLLALGLAALASSQPGLVAYPPVLLGAVGTFLGTALLQALQRRFTAEDAESA